MEAYHITPWKEGGTTVARVARCYDETATVQKCKVN